MPNETFDSEIIDAVRRASYDLMGNSFGPQALSGMIIAAAILQVGQTLAKRVSDLERAMISTYQHDEVTE